MAVNVNVIVIVIVIDPLIVAALVNGNDAVDLIDALDDQRSISFASIATVCRGEEFDRALVYFELLEVEHARAIGCSDRPIASSSTVSITSTASFPFTSAATIRGSITATFTITATAPGGSGAPSFDGLR
jgi:hypothetical protein